MFNLCSSPVGDGSSPEFIKISNFILSELRSHWKVLNRKGIVRCFKEYSSSRLYFHVTVTNVTSDSPLIILKVKIIGKMHFSNIFCLDQYIKIVYFQCVKNYH